ncbi:hypothetical protein, partial [Novosphingobium sp. Rr 2-17]|uniref:hypothetical protein n=1 Tax=Novosphingobium sp. Rr 2-17 TaxID=555793 RepID=UPI001ED970D0
MSLRSHPDRRAAVSPTEVFYFRSLLAYVAFINERQLSRIDNDPARRRAPYLLPLSTAQKVPYLE